MQPQRFNIGEFFLGGRVDWLDAPWKRRGVPVLAAGAVTISGVLGRAYAGDICQPISENEAADRCGTVLTHGTWLVVVAAGVLAAWLLVVRFGRRDVLIAAAIVVTILVAAAVLVGPALWVSGAPADGP